MTEEQRTIITSEDYFDLIVDYRNNPAVLDRYQDAIVHIMNEAYATIFIPVSQISIRSIGVTSYSTVPNVLGLTSEESLEASRVDELRRMPNLNLRGEGVLIGIIDTGINYSLPAFLNTDGSSKIASIWDQTIQSEDGYPYNSYFGTEYSAEQINAALESENPLEIVPSTDENGHGTMLAAIAAGTEYPVEDFYGVAPEAELIVVKLMQAKRFLREFFAIPEGVDCYQENHVMWGIQYCVLTARRLNRPLVICIGVGTSQDAHDGSSPLSQFLSIVGGFPRIGVVIAVGNEGNRGRHYYGVIDPEIGYNAVELNVGDDREFAMELWGNTPGIYSIDILSPSGEYIPRIPPALRVNREISFIFEASVINLEYQTIESFSGDQLILLRFRNASEGIWHFNVYGQGDLPLGFHIWLPMGDFITNTTYFIQPNIYTTIVTPSTSLIPIAITAYNPRNETLYVNSGRGYTRFGLIKPEMAAPGVNYVAPAVNGEFTSYSGTGVAAAHAAGVAALVMEWAAIRGNQPDINSLEIKGFLIRGARRNPNLTYPNRDWGYGILDIFNAFDVMRSNI